MNAVHYGSEDVAAAISSGLLNYENDYCAVFHAYPCEIAGNTTSLLTRPADFVLKERWRLVLLARESTQASSNVGNPVQTLKHSCNIARILAPACAAASAW